jgi:hypothetical protein
MPGRASAALLGPTWGEALLRLGFVVALPALAPWEWPSRRAIEIDRRHGDDALDAFERAGISRGAAPAVAR